MDLSLIQRLIEDNDPLQTLYEVLTGKPWPKARTSRSSTACARNSHR